MRRRILLAVPAALIAFSAAVTAARADDWGRYVNPRFGTAMDYPRDRFPAAPMGSANGDGATFVSGNVAAELRVWGAHDVADWRFADFTAAFAASTPVTWSQEKKDSWVVTGSNGATIRYSRCKRGGGLLHCFDISYPASEKSAWDAAVTRMSRSLGG
jgi:hypothetical protein